MKRIVSAVFLFLTLELFAGQREVIWPKGKMPDAQGGQIAAMSDEAGRKDFNPDRHRMAYIEWFEAPAPEVRNGGCMVLISGGAYKVCCEMGLIELWRKTFTDLGFQCVNLVYRTPRPEGLPFYQSAWEDGQRAIRLIRSEAASRGFDPEKIGTISNSSGSHLAVLLATSSQTPAYERVDALDDTPCHINWAIVNALAYATTDGETGTQASRQGYGVDVGLSDIFKFDGKTCPMSLHHGGMDPYSPNASTLVYRRLRSMGVPADMHLYPGKGHGAFGLDRAIEFLTQMGFLGKLEPEVALTDRFVSDSSRVDYFKEKLWPEGKTPSFQENQCEPYIEWHIPAVRTTDAIQIIYSGGCYTDNDPSHFDVTPARRYLNAKGMTVVTLKYRTPHPKGLAIYTTAWQDLQRAVRLVRGEAASRGLDPDRVGIMGSSAGGHLTILGATSSMHSTYLRVDDMDKLSCKVQWGISIYPAYVLTDGPTGPNKNGGLGDEDRICPEFSFDLDTAPLLMVHGDADKYASMGSVMLWEKMRAIGVQSELHVLAGRPHGFQRKASPGTGSYTYLDRVWDFLTEEGFNK